MKGKIYIETGLANGRTILKDCFFTTPFKIMDVTQEAESFPLRLMQMCSSPGILDGDEFNTEITVAENTSLRLETQSYQRLFNMKKGATQLIKVKVEKSASFVYLPHPCVPHTNSSFTASNKIYLHESSILVWGEIFTCGRKNNNEVFSFSKFHSLTDIFINDKLTLRENLLMEPELTDPLAIGQLEGYTHQASMIILNPACPHPTTKKNIYDFLFNKLDIRFGVSSAPENIIIIRILGYHAEQLFDLLKSIHENVTLSFTENQPSVV